MKRYLLSIVTLSFLLFSAERAQSAEELNCTTNLGAPLCRSLQIAKSYLVDCSGGCESLFYKQESAFQKIANYYYGNIYMTYTAAKDITSLAQSTAGKLCDYEWKNVETHLLSGLLVEANRALGVMKEVQLAGGVSHPEFCTITIKNGRVMAEYE